MPQDKIKEQFDSNLCLGDMLTKLLAARDAALEGDVQRMNGWLMQAHRELKGFEQDLKVIVFEREGVSQ